MARTFPLLTADQIECRVQTVTSTGCSVLLYKTARTDYEMFDKVFGAMGWQCKYEVINGNLYCSIGVVTHHGDTAEWIWKQNCGTESNTEKEKGEASDALKRAGFAWGCGTELYSAPFIWIKAESLEYDKNGKLKTRFTLTDIAYDENGCVSALAIADGHGTTIYTYGKFAKKSAPAKAKAAEPAVQPAPAPKAEKTAEKPAQPAPKGEPKCFCERCNKPLYVSSEAKALKDAENKTHVFCKACAAELMKGE